MQTDLIPILIHPDLGFIWFNPKWFLKEYFGKARIRLDPISFQNFNQGIWKTIVWIGLYWGRLERN